MELLTSQQTAITKLQKLKVGALFMEMGTGKTLTAYQLVVSVLHLVDFVLWFTPCQTKQSLSLEIEKCGGLPNLRIVGIETISSSDRTYLELMELVSTQRVFIVVDESLKIKNWEAKRTKRIIELGKHCQFKLVLNGTPLSRNLLDIWAQLEFLSPKILGMDLSRFKSIFCEIVTVKKVINGKLITNEFITKNHNIDYLYSIINPYVYECALNVEVKKLHVNKNYSIDEDNLETYQEIKSYFLKMETLFAHNNNIFLSMINKLQHSYCTCKSKINLLKEIISQHDVDKIIIYTKYVKSSELLKKEFPSITVLSLQKHAYGLNLQSKNVTIFFDKTYNYAELLQSEARTHRMGQNMDCIYYSLSADNVGLDAMINGNIGKKKFMLDYFKEVGFKQIMSEL